MGTTEEQTAPKKQPTSYFYVVIPPEDQAVSNDSSKAVSSSAELIAIMKRNPRARFMAASTAEEARKKALEKIQFSKEAESITSPPTTAPKRKGRQSFSAVEASVGAAAVETPKTGELLMMGREIITKRNEQVFEKIEKNPRILCTDSEFPTILQEGCKYNAVHLAAKSNNFEVLKRILNLASSVDFMRRIYPNQNEESLLASCKHLTTCYLNSPDKMLQDSPLHFACKFNAVECVDILLSHPFCDTSLKNFDKLTPLEVVGSRDDPKSAKASSIRRLFANRYIVPIWRDLAVDGDPPVLGDVSFIHDLGQAIPDPLLRTNFPDFSIQLLSGCKPNLAPKSSSSTVKVFVSQPISWKIQAFAGPMDEVTAREFRQILKRSRYWLFGHPTTPETSFNMSDNHVNVSMCTPPGTPRPIAHGTPPHSGHLILSPIKSPLSRRSICDSPVMGSPLKTDMAVRVRDVDKGLERIASEYCGDMGISWFEYWKFLGAFCNLASDEGLEILENHFVYLESRKREMLEEDSSEFKENDPPTTSNYLDDVIEKLDRIKLSESGMSTPDKNDGIYCRNPNCRLESRFCNCEDVVPPVPFEEEDDFDPVVFTYGDNLFCGKPFAGKPEIDHVRSIRKLDLTSNSDSFDMSTKSGEDDFEWPCPDVEPMELFKTAPSSPVEDEPDADKEVFEECYMIELYLSGDEPGKLDFQVFQTIRDSCVNVDPYKYLLTFQWMNAMRSYAHKPVPHFCTPTAGGTPKRPWGPSFVSTPRRVPNLSLDFDLSFDH